MAASLILDSSGAPIPRQMPLPQPYITDGVTEAMQAAAGFGQFGGGRISAMQMMFASQLAAAAYLSSGMLQKVIELPAVDRVREWRDWQAEEDQITALEAEERRLGLRQKIIEAEVLRGLGGGALILLMDGQDHASELKPDQVRKGSLVAVNVLSREELDLVDIDKEVASPTYRQPKFFRVKLKDGVSSNIHPSRVICFKAKRLPAGYTTTDEDHFWGHSMLMRVFREVEKSDNAQMWFAALVKKAKLLRIGIPGLTDMAASPGGTTLLTKRMSAISLGENSLNATVYEAADSDGHGGEVISDFQMSFNGIPAMMDGFDQRIAAVSGIPFTVLMGRSPAGMNATGDHDRDNWNREVATGQSTELGPCLDQIDVALIPSALGSRPDDVWWKFAPLDTPTAKEETDRFKIWTDAMEKVGNSGTIPDIAFSKAYQNGLIENEWAPGLEAALDEVPAAERYPEGPSEEEIIAEAKAEALAQSKGGDQSTGGKQNLPKKQ